MFDAAEQRSQFLFCTGSEHLEPCVARALHQLQREQRLLSHGVEILGLQQVGVTP